MMLWNPGSLDPRLNSVNTFLVSGDGKRAVLTGGVEVHLYSLDGGLKEMLALEESDPARGLEEFDRAFWGHVGHSCLNALRACSRGWTFGYAAPWGLGVAVEFSGGTGRRAFGHGGMASSRAFADPDLDLVVVVVANGLPSIIPAEQRMLEITDAIYTALGEEAARIRKPVEAIMKAFGSGR